RPGAVGAAPRHRRAARRGPRAAVEGADLRGGRRLLPRGRRQDRGHRGVRPRDVFARSRRGDGTGDAERPVRGGRSSRWVGAAVCALATFFGCGSAEEEESASAGEAVSVDRATHSVYGITVFGGPGDEQSLACGGDTQTSQPWYVASAQRYGCGVHVRIEAN